ncbi:nitrilase-related carbon-nitrogen hydrolase [Roseibium salinum]|nr:nitrilase-related carbon-nitrogen hydrolase [Roseibium salinum]
MSEAPLGGSARVGQPRLVVWPESAVPFLLTQQPGALFRIAAALGSGTELVTGAIRAETGVDGPDYFNSVYVIAEDGTVKGIYDKVRLVPFGEFVPLKWLLEELGISSLAAPPSKGLTPGTSSVCCLPPKVFSFSTHDLLRSDLPGPFCRGIPSARPSC